MFGSQDRSNFFGNIGRLAKDYVDPIGLKEEKFVEPLPGLKISGFKIEHTDRLDDGSHFPSSTYGYEIQTDEARFVYTPDIGSLSDEVLTRIEGANLFMLDASFWWNDELSRISGLAKTSYDLGHVPVEESVEILKGKGIGRVIYTHLNHTNPLMDPGHPATSILEKRGFETAFDGMRIKV